MSNPLIKYNFNSYSVPLLFFFLQKLATYEPGIIELIKQQIGVPKMRVGSLFRFKSQPNNLDYQVVRVCRLNPLEEIFKSTYCKNNKIDSYKYGYCIKDYNGIQVLNFIYDSYIDAGYVIILS